jgi:hypothetical protein
MTTAGEAMTLLMTGMRSLAPGSPLALIWLTGIVGQLKVRIISRNMAETRRTVL